MKPARILLVEPDPLRLVGLRAALFASGYQCTGFETAAAAAAAPRSGRYDVVLLGPGHDESGGRAAAAAIRASLAETVAIVVLTALKDLMIGHAVAGAAPPPDLPAMLEALTRYMRFAPARPQAGPAENERLVGDWAAFDSGGER